MAKIDLESQCLLCTLPREGDNLVKGEGSLKSSVVFVGEAPGKQEVMDGRPFVGKAGILLDIVLRNLKIERKKCFITNACLCRPPKNRTPTWEEMECCRPRLVKEIKKIAPKVIVAMGGSAIQAIFNDPGTTVHTKRGPGRWSKEFACWIIPTYHPAAFLYRPFNFTDFVNDLKKIEELQSKKLCDLPSLESRYYVLDTVAKCLKIIAFLAEKKLLACDIETTGLNWKADKMIALGFTDKEDRCLIIPEKMLQNALVKKHLKSLFENREIKFLWQNGQYDIKWLREMGINARVDEDILLEHYCLDERRKIHSLTNLCQEFLGEGAYEAKFKALVPKDGTYDDAPKKELYQYLAHDADYTFKIHNILKPRLLAEGRLINVYEKILIPATNMLSIVEETGIRVDLERIAKLRKQYEAEIAKLKKDMEIIASELKFDPESYCKATGAKALPKKFNVNSPKQLAYLLFDVMKLSYREVNEGWMIRKYRETANRALDRLFYDVLDVAKGGGKDVPGCIKFVHSGFRGELTVWIPKERLKDPKNRFVNNLLLYRRATKILNTFLIPPQELSKYDGRVRSHFLLFGTETGRLSSIDPNFQNIPRDPAIRGIYIAAEGKVLIETDYSKAENRMLTFLSQDEKMLKIYEENRDIHDEVAKEMFGPNFTYVQRAIAKSLTFGIPYGRWYKSIAYQFHLKDEEGAEMIKEWYKKYPTATKWLQEQRDKISHGEESETLFGRKRRWGFIPDKKAKFYAQKQAINFPIQSTTSDCVMISAIELCLELDNDIKLVNLIHDSLLWECSEHYFEEAAKRIKEKMEAVPKREIGIGIPFDADVSVGKRWGSLKKWKGSE